MTSHLLPPVYASPFPVFRLCFVKHKAESQAVSPEAIEGIYLHHAIQFCRWVVEFGLLVSFLRLLTMARLPL